MVQTLEVALFGPISQQTIVVPVPVEQVPFEQLIVQIQIVLLHPELLPLMILLEPVVMIEITHLIMQADLPILLETLDDLMTEIQFHIEILVTLTETTRLQEPLAMLMVQVPLLDLSMRDIPQDLFLIEVLLMNEVLVMTEVILEQLLMEDPRVTIVVMKKGEILVTELPVDTLPEQREEVVMLVGDTKILKA
jgi:hypothetical protein